jgi:hypothetical protein
MYESSCSFESFSFYAATASRVTAGGAFRPASTPPSIGIVVTVIQLDRRPVGETFGQAVSDSEAGVITDALRHASTI